YGILPVSQDENALAVDRVRYVGDPVAAVAADDAEIAERALSLIEVDYEPLAEVVDLGQGLSEDRPLIHGEGSGRNVHRSVALEFGDVDEGFGV
ncbi:MAG: aldehyde oxidase, partial [Planctomycetota bacterium]|nr:aldehyde oxidase [Planctomycetota bacterium]